MGKGERDKGEMDKGNNKAQGGVRPQTVPGRITTAVHCERSEAISFTDRDCFVAYAPGNDRSQLLAPFSGE